MDAFKTCSKCVVSKSATEFYARKKGRDGLNSRCKKCYAEWQFNNKNKDIEAFRAKRRAVMKQYRRKTDQHGIYRAEREKILELQGGVCAICGTTNPGDRGWNIDHCHSSKDIRGMLCRSCNLMLGFARDNISTLSKAISYLTSGVSFGKSKK